MTGELIVLAGVSTTVAAFACMRLVRFAQRLVIAAVEEETGPSSIRPWHHPTADCALCGQSRYLLKVKYEGTYLKWLCPECSGTYRTFTKGDG